MKELFVALIFFVKSMIGEDDGPISTNKIILIVAVAVTLVMLVLIFFTCRSKSHWSLFNRRNSLTEFKYTNPLYTGQNTQEHHLTTSTLNSDVTLTNASMDCSTRFWLKWRLQKKRHMCNMEQMCMSKNNR